MYQKLIKELKDNNLFQHISHDSLGREVLVAFLSGSRILGDNFLDKHSDFDLIQAVIDVKDHPFMSKKLCYKDDILIEIKQIGVKRLESGIRGSIYNWAMYLNSFFTIDKAIYINEKYKNEVELFLDTLKNHRKFFVIGTINEMLHMINKVKNNNTLDAIKPREFKMLYRLLYLYYNEAKIEKNMSLIKKFKRLRRDDITDQDIIELNTAIDFLLNYRENNNIDYTLEYNALLNDLREIKWEK